ncbi:MAG: bifunctional serine/threonine-protein kinase/formylglycine-generating enzyme family protein [Planctomycetota bacterium]|nr:bifunctional serine/threonine-protein kinase/formylglycine-generating enzyme family protein [Planctomycetota bacterium]
MPDAPRDDTHLPEAIEDEVLAILEGDEGARDPALEQLLDRHPQHARTIRAWLTGAGLNVPGTAGAATSHGGAPGPEALPIRLGQYVLQQLLGRGGFGTVYRAEQQEPIRRPVAVKVLNPGMDSREVLARFAAEREALNRMDHPGIARLLDAGQTAQGRPFFVMELVEGPTLANLCRAEDLPLRARLELFLQVLDATQHAHQKAVLHRDLSSNNVLVADPHGRAQCKIIDFGIAKSLADPLLQGGAMTFQGTLMGTPEFMSPEQAAGSPGDVDTRADVYALGVQLYELLTDTLPIPGVVLRAQGIAGMAEVIATHQEVRPREAAGRERRAALYGDLDAITMKAIAKARDERYATVAGFAADLRAHLADQPVQVVSPTTWYRLRKFVRRHRAQSAAVAIVGCGLLVALGVLLWALHIKNTALAHSEQQQDEMAAKVDAGFRLLANEERLREANAAAAVLPPPWPEHAAAFTGWLATHGTPLATELDKVRSKLAALTTTKVDSAEGQFTDPIDQYLFTALERLAAELGAFTGDGGPLARVRSKLRLLDEVVAPAGREHAALWQQTITEIKHGDGGTGRDYRGVQIPVLPGLVPLGRHPRTGLFEFLDLCSHQRGLLLPQRDAGTGDLRLGAGTGIVFVLVPVGAFRIGATRGEPGLPQDDPGAADDELDGQRINLDEFLIGKTELTIGQWAVLAGRSAAGDDPLLPITGVDWHEARGLLRQFDLDLPTEAQWEHACRAGTTTPWWCGADALKLPEHAWFGSRPRPQAVGLLRGNGFGLFDLHGNVAEWCRDAKLPYHDFAPATGDGLRRNTGDAGTLPRVVRGGAFYQGAVATRSAAREGRSPLQRDSATGVRPIRLMRRQ